MAQASSSSCQAPSCYGLLYFALPERINNSSESPLHAEFARARREANFGDFKTEWVLSFKNQLKAGLRLYSLLPVLGLEKRIEFFVRMENCEAWCMILSYCWSASLKELSTPSAPPGTTLVSGTQSLWYAVVAWVWDHRIEQSSLVLWHLEEEISEIKKNRHQIEMTTAEEGWWVRSSRAEVVVIHVNSKI